MAFCKKTRWSRSAGRWYLKEKRQQALIGSLSGLERDPERNEKQVDYQTSTDSEIGASQIYL